MQRTARAAQGDRGHTAPAPKSLPVSRYSGPGQWSARYRTGDCSALIGSMRAGGEFATKKAELLSRL
jgi:hypothetical protein